MKVKLAGHEYELRNKNDAGFTPLTFVNTEPGSEAPGTSTQEVCRALIDRTRYCNNCLPHPNNERIIYHLRMVIALHEARALERMVQKDGYPIEHCMINKEGHLELRIPPYPANATLNLNPWSYEWDQQPDYERKDTDPDDKQSPN